MRRIFQRRARLVTGAWLLLLVCCSSGPENGPGEVVWDRDTCERCSMVIGDRRFAAQVRDSRDSRLRRFDDLGCALLWQVEIEKAAGPSQIESQPEVWVRDPSGERWIDGHTARFAAGFKTPMGYGFAAVEGSPPESLDLVQTRAYLLAREEERKQIGR